PMMYIASRVRVMMGLLIVTLTLSGGAGAAASVAAAAGLLDCPQGVEVLESLDHLPVLCPGLQVLQVSSFDRTGGNNDGFDVIYSYLYRDENGEYVLLDERRPGSVYRMWFTNLANIGTVKFYFDG